MIAQYQEYPSSPWQLPTGNYEDPIYAQSKPTDPHLPLAWQEDPYAVYSTLGLGYKTPPLRVTYDTLRRMVESDVVVAIVHEVIATIVSNFFRKPRSEYDIGFKIRHKTKNERQYTRNDRKRQAELESWFLKMGVADGDLTRDSFRTFAEKTVKDWLTYAQAGAEITKTRGGTPHSLRYIPGYTLRLTPPENPQAYVSPHQQRVRTKYVQLNNEQLVINRWTEEQILWSIHRPRRTLYGYGYGEPPLETLINTIAGHLMSEQWNYSIFKNGSMVPGILNIEGNPGREKMADLRRQFILQAVGVHNAHRILITNAQGIDWKPMNWSSNEMGFQQWLAYLIEQICGIYMVSHDLVGIEVKRRLGGKGGSSSQTISRAPEAKIEGNREKFLKPFLYRFEELFNGPKVMEQLDEDWEFAFYGIDPKDEEKDIELRLKKGQHYVSMNELREMDGLEPKDGWDIPANAVLAGHLQQQQAMQMQQAPTVGEPQHTSQGNSSPTAQNKTRELPSDSRSDQKSIFDLNKALPAYAASPFDETRWEVIS